MNIKTFMVAAVAALSVAACSEAPTETVEVPVNETAAADIQLNDDGSVKTEATEAPVEATEAAK